MPALVPQSNGERVREFNQCHSPVDGKFCSTSGAGDELTDSPAAPVGAPFRVFRIGRGGSEASLAGRNAGNADAVDDLYMRSLDDDGPLIGDTLHVFEVVLTAPAAGYHRYNQRVASELKGVEPPRAGVVGRHRRDTELLYSFPPGGAWTAKRIASLQTEKVFRQWGSTEERVAHLRKKISDALR